MLKDRLTKATNVVTSEQMPTTELMGMFHTFHRIWSNKSELTY